MLSCRVSQGEPLWRRVVSDPRHGVQLVNANGLARPLYIFGWPVIIVLLRNRPRV
jgi:hypothetical protein